MISSSLHSATCFMGLRAQQDCRLGPGQPGWTLARLGAKRYPESIVVSGEESPVVAGPIANYAEIFVFPD